MINARDAMPDGGRVTITTANLHLTATDDARGNGVRPGAYVTLSVQRHRRRHGRADAGPHLRSLLHHQGSPGRAPDSACPRCTASWSRAAGTSQSKARRARAPRFTIFLPRHAGTLAEAAGPADRRSFPRGTETLLLVEDEAAVRSSARRLLERHGYTVIEARHGADALRIVEAGDRAVDLVITDVVMPEMGGRELVERLRTRHPGVKVLFMSGYSERAVASDGVMPPGTGFVEKPFTIEQLTRRTRELLDG